MEPSSKDGHSTTLIHPLAQPVGMSDSILRPAVTDQPDICPNSWLLTDFNSKYIHNANVFQKRLRAICPTTEISSQDRLITLFHTFFRGLDVQHCKATRCEKNRAQCFQVLPPCRWFHFREFVGIIASCSLSALMHATLRVWLSVSRPDRPAFHLPRRLSTTPKIEIGTFIAFNMGKDSSSLLDSETVKEILAVVDWFNLWAETETESQSTGDMSATLSSLKNMQQGACVQLIQDKMKNNTLQELGICPNRLWNLAVGRSNDLDYMLTILDYLSLHRQEFQLPRQLHQDCTEQLCTRAHDDTTTTRQLHKCAQEDCGTTIFSAEILNNAFHGLDTPVPWIQTAWDVTSWSSGTGPRLLGEGEPFIAISHVWADGTGNGLNRPGVVNTCLVRYWADIAISLKCNGIWWDTICVPTEKQSRRKALDVMLENYSRAKYVVVHDQSLVSTPWVSSESAAVAIILSTWFTRGWTAAELYSTRKRIGNVKVLFQDPQYSHQPILKDLDRSIMISGNPTTLVHLKASKIIQTIRKNVGELRTLLQILRTRSTAWDKDKMVVASLMTLGRATVDTSRSIPELTRAILKEIMTIPRTAIFHSQVPMTFQGGWSWCPPSIFDLDTRYAVLESDDNQGSLMIEEDGSISGSFPVFSLRTEDEHRIMPYGSHPSIICKVASALENPETCLILKVDGRDASVIQGLLVNAFAHDKEYIYCRYIACVQASFQNASKLFAIKCTISDERHGDDGMPLPPLIANEVLAGVQSDRSEMPTS